MEENKVMFAEIALSIALDKKFTYAVPEEFRPAVYPGARVFVNFNNRRQPGVVIKLQNSIPEQRYSIKPLLSLMDPAPVYTEELIQLAGWITDNYGSSLGESFNSIFNFNVLPPAPHKNTVTETQMQLTWPAKKTGQPKPDIAVPGIYLASHLSHPEQINTYIDLITGCINNNGNCIFIVPEILLCNEWHGILKSHFGGLLAFWHSKLTNNEKYITWQLIIQNKARIVFGTRSAVLTPVQNLKLIIMGNESDDSYKQINKPMYNTVDIARQRIKYHDGSMVLGSWIPSLDSYYRSIKKPPEYTQLKIKPENDIIRNISVTLVNLRDEQQRCEYKPHVFSKELVYNIEQRIARKELSILFYNRTGTAKVLKCTNCGTVLLCPKCHLALAYHGPVLPHNSAAPFKEQGELKCHHCTGTYPVEQVCSNCKTKNFKFTGAGIDRIQTELKSIFPQARIAQFDSTTRDNTGENLNKLTQKEDAVDIVLGTQMLFHLLPHADKINKLYKLTLLSVLNMDTLLYLPEFHSAERAFQTAYDLTEFARYGKIDYIIQTYNIGHYIFPPLMNLDWKKFYKSELKTRKDLEYPPFSDIINLIISGKNGQHVAVQTDRINEILTTLFESAGKPVRILGPSDIKHSLRKRGKLSQQLILKFAPGTSSEIVHILKSIKPEKTSVDFSIDVNPYETNY